VPAQVHAEAEQVIPREGVESEVGGELFSLEMVNKLVIPREGVESMTQLPICALTYLIL